VKAPALVAAQVSCVYARELALNRAAGSLPEGSKREYTDAVELVESLMDRKPEQCYRFIQERAPFVRDLDV
jgi:hypothetical protein